MKINFNSKQILRGIRFLNQSFGRDADDILGYYTFEDLFEAMNCDITDMPPRNEFGSATTPPNEMTVEQTEIFWKKLNKEG